MAAKTEVRPFELPGFVDGLNREADPYKLKPTESPDALNVDFGQRGEATKRKGYTTKWTDAAVSEHVYSFLVDEVVHVRADGTIRYISGGTSTDSTKALTDSTDARSYQLPAVSLNYKLYLTRHTNDNPVRWDGTTWTDMTSWDGADATGVFPNAAVATVAHNRIFAANIRLSGGTVHNSRFYFSDVIDPEAWQALNFFDVAPDDGQEIRQIILFGDQLFVFKDHAIYVVVGTNELEFDVWPMDSALGTTAPQTVVNMGAQLVFFDPMRGVYAFDGGGFTRISENINSYLLDGMNVTEIHKAKGWQYRNRYFLSVPWGVDAFNSRTFVYDPRNKAWTEYDFGFQDAVETVWGPLAVGVRNGNNIVQLFNGQADIAAAIPAYVKTSWIAPASPSMKHRVRRLDATLSALGDYDITVNMYRDFEPDVYITKLVNTLTTTSVYGTGVYGTAQYGFAASQLILREGGWGERWRACQFEFEENTTGTFQVNRMIALVSANYRSRGEAD